MLWKDEVLGLALKSDSIYLWVEKGEKEEKWAWAVSNDDAAGNAAADVAVAIVVVVVVFVVCC